MFLLAILYSVAEGMDDRLIEKYPEGSGRGLIEVSWNLPGGTEETMKYFRQDSECLG
jgi:hypothetical protein